MTQREVFNPDKDYVNSQTLVHYGVPGMKWGKRKAGSDSGGKSESKKGDGEKKVSKKEAKKAKSATSHLSDAELRDRVARLQLEQQYAKLTVQKSKLKRGKEFAETLTAVNNATKSATSTATTVYDFYKSPTGQMLANVIIKQGGGRRVAGR